MKIKVAILDQDEEYLKRLTSGFTQRYGNELEIRTYTKQETAQEALLPERIDVFLAEDIFEIDVKSIPERCGFAYLVDKLDVRTIKGHKAICKFQKVDVIYKEILNLYADYVGSITNVSADDSKTRVISFISPTGGSGSSTVAAACALHFAQQGKKAFYLSLDPFDITDSLFQGEGKFDFSEIVFALKSKKINLDLKLKSVVKRDYTGVFFISGSKIALDMVGLNGEELSDLLKGIKDSGEFDDIIVDVPFEFSKECIKLLRDFSNEVVITENDTQDSICRTGRFLEALDIYETKEAAPLIHRICLILNRTMGQMPYMGNTAERILGMTPDYGRGFTRRQVAEKLSTLTLFDQIYTH